MCLAYCGTHQPGEDPAGTHADHGQAHGAEQQHRRRTQQQEGGQESVHSSRTTHTHTHSLIHSYIHSLLLYSSALFLAPQPSFFLCSRCLCLLHTLLPPLLFRFFLPHVLSLIPLLCHHSLPFLLLLLFLLLPSLPSPHFYPFLSSSSSQVWT